MYFDSIKGRILLFETGGRLRVECSAENQPLVKIPVGAQEKAIPVIKIQIS